ncbi:hypothetical protein [Cellulomonas xylanilytica]|uniref:SHOCT domain-containing protein n=1 Tax=Cellulomonas xylanilytica TaxID=233583 RepID=A0A510V0Q6_9CELL|nr:hypothetical protein [Cellulomonas xylanilytica]GEK20346.1 hypothetical protein CXY01_08660 [Cellulomonas xylanilytica]
MFGGSLLVEVTLMGIMAAALVAVVLAAVVARRLAPEPGHAAGRSPSAGRTVESRLAETDDLHDRGLISADELTAARRRIFDQV